MTVLTQNPDPKSVNPNHDPNQDTHSTVDMVCCVFFAHFCSFFLFFGQLTLRLNSILDLLGQWHQLQAAYKRQNHLWHFDHRHLSDGLLPAERNLHSDFVSLCLRLRTGATVPASAGKPKHALLRAAESAVAGRNEQRDARLSAQNPHERSEGKCIRASNWRLFS